MNEISQIEKDPDKMATLKTLTAVVYLCQIFLFALVPLLVGVAINFLKRKEVEGTWLESHFDWQIKTVWIALAGFFLAGITYTMGIGYFILIAVLILTVYRIVIGWTALSADKPVKEG
ncbi:MAG: DUF4870 family protein [Gammaproteobacteria bacterium]